MDATTDRKLFTRAALAIAVRALQCDAWVRALTTRDPDTTGFHRLASGKMAERAWKCCLEVATNEGGDPNDLALTVMHGADAAESAENLLIAYSNTLRAPKECVS